MNTAFQEESFSNQKQLNFLIYILLLSAGLLYVLTFITESNISFSEKAFSLMVPLVYIGFISIIYFNNFLLSKAKYIYPISCALIITYVWQMEKGSIDNIFIYFPILVMSTLYFDYKPLLATTIGIAIINILAFAINKETFFPSINLGQFFSILISFIFVGIFLSFIVLRVVTLFEQTKKEESKARQEEAKAKKEELKSKKVVARLEKALHTLDKTNKDLRQTQTQLVQHEKMASLGMLVAGVAHEINNPVGAINSNTNLYKVLIHHLSSSELIQENQKTQEIVSKLNTINQTNIIACERIMEIVKSLKNFARLDEAEFKDADIHEGLDSTLILLKHKLKNNIEVIKSYGQLPIIQCYPNQLNQVFMNLLANAIDAIPNAGTVWIETYAQDEKVFIIVRDSGTGIKQENLDRIFDPGFTTKGVGVGAGLGLSIVYNIIEKHKGKITVKSKQNKGTEFIIELPINPK